MRVVNWTPAFDGRNQDLELGRTMSLDVALAVTYYDSINFNLALAIVAFDKNINKTPDLSKAVWQGRY